MYPCNNVYSTALSSVTGPFFDHLSAIVFKMNKQRLLANGIVGSQRSCAFLVPSRWLLGALCAWRKAFLSYEIRTYPAFLCVPLPNSQWVKQRKRGVLSVLQLTVDWRTKKKIFVMRRMGEYLPIVATGLNPFCDNATHDWRVFHVLYKGEGSTGIVSMVIMLTVLFVLEKNKENTWEMNGLIR